MNGRSLTNFLLLGVGLVILLIAVAFWRMSHQEPAIEAALTMESDAMAVVNYYYPVRLPLQRTPFEPELILPASSTGTRSYAALYLGNAPDSLFSIMYQQADDGSNQIYVDLNNNEDLTDDGESNWDESKRGYSSKEVLLEVAYRAGEQEIKVPYPVVLYHYLNKLSDMLVAYRNGYRRGELEVADTSFQIALFDDNCNGLFDELKRGALVVDLNQDGTLDGRSDSDEYFKIEQPIVIGDQVFRVAAVSASGDHIRFTKQDTVAPPLAEVEENATIPPFRTLDINGEVLDFGNLRGKVLMIDFWATWCKPWEARRDFLKELYRKHSRSDFEIVGVSLDYDVSHLIEYVEEHRMNWPQIGDGSGWDMSLVRLFKVRALPKNLLVDKMGGIRYKDLSGKNLERKIYELLAESDGQD